MGTTLREIHYRCRDIGYGVENETVIGIWLDEVDWTGKRTLILMNDERDALYLFSDEVVTDEEISPEDAALTH